MQRPNFPVKNIEQNFFFLNDLNHPDTQEFTYTCTRRRSLSDQRWWSLQVGYHPTTQSQTSNHWFKREYEFELFTWTWKTKTGNPINLSTPRTRVSDHPMTRNSGHVIADTSSTNSQKHAALDARMRPWRTNFSTIRILGLETQNPRRRHHTDREEPRLFFLEPPITPLPPRTISTSPVTKFIRETHFVLFCSTQKCSFNP